MTPQAAAALGIVWGSVVAILIYRAVRQYGKYELLSPMAAPHPAPLVRVIVPARNEEAGIEACVASLLAQDYPRDRLAISAVDDSSTDATPTILGKLAAADARLRVLAGEPLPAGWAGKPHACWQAARDAVAADSAEFSRDPKGSAGAPRGDDLSRASSSFIAGGGSPAPLSESAKTGASATGYQGEPSTPLTAEPWLCFIDADTVSEPALISSAVAMAESRKLDMLSLEPFQLLVTPGERLVLPAGFFVLAFTQDLGRVNDPASADAKANGQFILIRRSVYDAVGGHAAVRGEISEDGKLAQIVKGRGYRIGLIGAESLIRTRMFRDFRAVWNGLGRSAAETIGGPGLTIVFCIAGLVLAGLAIAAPLLTTLCVREGASSALAIAGCAAAWAGTLALLGVHIGAARHFRIPVYYGVLFPIGYLLAAAVGINSAIRHLRGQIAWKGRVYQPSEASS